MVIGINGTRLYLVLDSPFDTLLFPFDILLCHNLSIASALKSSILSVVGKGIRSSRCKRTTIESSLLIIGLAVGNLATFRTSRKGVFIIAYEFVHHFLCRGIL